MADDISGAIPGLLGIAIVAGVASKMIDGPRANRPRMIRPIRSKKLRIPKKHKGHKWY